ncbi:MAG: hypothetical protein P8M73_05480 [Luminiphilus sp.]|nr:hypothetical protein [Luminiphilus sp.]
MRKFLVSSAVNLSAVVSVGLLLVLSGCAEDGPTDAERSRCFDQYIREHSAEYPVETLKKTAALKCYS